MIADHQIDERLRRNPLRDVVRSAKLAADFDRLAGSSEGSLRISTRAQRHRLEQEPGIDQHRVVVVADPAIDFERFVGPRLSRREVVSRRGRRSSPSSR